MLTWKNMAQVSKYWMTIPDSNYSERNRLHIFKQITGQFVFRFVARTASWSFSALIIGLCVFSVAIFGLIWLLCRCCCRCFTRGSYHFGDSFDSQLRPSLYVSFLPRRITFDGNWTGESVSTGALLSHLIELNSTRQKCDVWIGDKCSVTWFLVSYHPVSSSSFSASLSSSSSCSSLSSNSFSLVWNEANSARVYMKEKY